MMPFGCWYCQACVSPGRAPLRLWGARISGRMDGVEAGDDRGVEDLFEGVLPGLPGLELDEIEDLLLAVEQPVVEAQEDLRPLGERSHRPILLGEAQARLGEDDVLRRRARQGADEGMVER